MIRISDDVYEVDCDIASLGEADVEVVRARAAASPRRRARVCTHRDAGDAVHEMLIALHRDTYIHPHRHLHKSESFHVVEGEVDVVVLDDEGGVADVIELGPFGGDRCFYYRMSTPAFHTLIIRSEFLVVHEVTSGPFDRKGTEMARFAPGEDQPERCAAYRDALVQAVTQWQSERRAAPQGRG